MSDKFMKNEKMFGGKSKVSGSLRSRCANVLRTGMGNQRQKKSCIVPIYKGREENGGRKRH